MAASSYKDLTADFQVNALPTIGEVDYLRPKIKQLLREFKQALSELYGERLASLVLYGSVARHEETEDADVDVLVVLRGKTISRFDEIRQMGDAKFELLLKFDELVSVVPMMHDDFLHRESPLLRNVRREGILV